MLAMALSGCGAQSVSNAPRHAANPAAGVRGTCCGSSNARTAGARTAGPAPCDEFEELERRFRNAKPIRTLFGKATYYSNKLAGHAMASGEIYNPACAQAAHRHLPFGSVVRVVILDPSAAHCGRTHDGPKQDRFDDSVVVRIADRGPFGGRGRIIDLSYAAARRIGLLRQGVADVRVEVLKVP
jgi:Lytic transglycolase